MRGHVAPLLVSEMISVTNQQWILPTVSEERVDELRKVARISPLLARILVARGITPQDIHSFLNPTLRDLMPDPSLLLDMDTAVERVAKALVQKENIVLYGDYDVDGATSTALLARYFRHLGFQVRFYSQTNSEPAIPGTRSTPQVDIYIPDRLTEGYGVNLAALERLTHNGAQLIIMVDCGTTSVKEIAWAKNNSIDTIILDHHIAGLDLPEALAVINPHRRNHPDVPWTKDLCSAGLVFLFLVALQRYLRENHLFDTSLPNLMSFCDLVALGTVCDVVPLRGLNRALVQRGLEKFSLDSFGEDCLGLKALCSVADIKTKVTARHLGFALGPRINAGGRIGSSTLGAELLTATDVSKAQDLAEALDRLNHERRHLEAEALKEAYAFLEAQDKETALCLLVGSERWHPGIVGLVASRLKDLYHRPSFVASFQDGFAKGSARSVEGLDIGALIHKACQEGIIDKGGGHVQAGGFTVALERWELLRSFLQQAVQEFIASFQPKISLDAVADLSEITLEALSQLDVMEPFGAENPAPRLAFFNILPQEVRNVGENHLRMRLTASKGSPLSAIAFRCKGTPLEDALLSGQRLHIVGTLRRNHWQNTTTVQLVIEDVALAT